MVPLLAALALAVPAADLQQAERLAKKSMVEYNLGDFEAALEDATAAYKLSARPGLLFNLGQCQRALQHWSQAEFFYRGYLRDKPNASNRAAVEKLVKEMAERQSEAQRTPAPASGPSSAPSVPLVIVPPPPSSAPALSLEPAPTAAPVVQVEKPAGRSHLLPLTLLGVAAAGLVLGSISAGELIDYQSYRNAVGGGTQVVYSSFESRGNTANLFSALLFVGIGLTVAGVGGAVLTW